MNPFYEMMYQQVLLPSIDNLYKAQYAAAQEQGYEDKYSHLKEWGDQNASTWIDNKRDDTWWMDEQLKLGSSQPTEWSMWYNDQDKDMSIAQTADELQAQLDTIAGYSDRSRVQKDFLSQKAQVRYWMDQISKFGGAQDLAENLFNNRDNQLRYASPRLATDDTIDSSFNNIVPWANAGEGVLPSDLTNLDLQLDDWWVQRLNEINSDNADLVNAFDPDGDFDVLVPDTNEQLGEGTSGWAVDEADTTWGTGGTDKPDDKPDDPPKDQPDEPEDVMYNFPDLGGQFDDGGTVDGGFFGGHWNDGGNTDGNWGWGGGDEGDGTGGWTTFTTTTLPLLPLLRP